jgi:hypothetical protein
VKVSEEIVKVSEEIGKVSEVFSVFLIKVGKVQVVFPFVEQFDYGCGSYLNGMHYLRRLP